MFDDEIQNGFQNILTHIEVCEKRFLKISEPKDFVSSEEGLLILDAVVTRLQAIAENVKRIIKKNPKIEEIYPTIEWNKIVRFRDFISHHYDLLDYEVVYDICAFELNRLKTIILIELSKD